MMQLIDHVSLGYICDILRCFSTDGWSANKPALANIAAVNEFVAITNVKTGSTPMTRAIKFSGTLILCAG